MRKHPIGLALALGALLVTAAPSRGLANALDGSTGFSAPVPASAFAFPSAWLDPSRLHVTSSISVGSTGGRGGLDALQVTSLQYAFGPPLTVGLSFGNAWGPAAVGRNSSMFLEGLDLAWRPSPAFQFQVQYRDIRSPLQLSRGPFGRGTW